MTTKCGYGYNNINSQPPTPVTSLPANFWFHCGFNSSIPAQEGFLANVFLIDNEIIHIYEDMWDCDTSDDRSMSQILHGPKQQDDFHACTADECGFWIEELYHKEPSLEEYYCALDEFLDSLEAD